MKCEPCRAGQYWLARWLRRAAQGNASLGISTRAQDRNEEAGVTSPPPTPPTQCLSAAVAAAAWDLRLRWPLWSMIHAAVSEPHWLLLRPEVAPSSW